MPSDEGGEKTLIALVATRGADSPMGRDRTRKVSTVDSLEWTAWIKPVVCLCSLLCVLDSLCSADLPLVACFQGSGELPADRGVVSVYFLSLPPTFSLMDCFFTPQSFFQGIGSYNLRFYFLSLLLSPKPIFDWASGIYKKKESAFHVTLLVNLPLYRASICYVRREAFLNSRCGGLAFVTG